MAGFSPMYALHAAEAVMVMISDTAFLSHDSFMLIGGCLCAITRDGDISIPPPIFQKEMMRIIILPFCHADEMMDDYIDDIFEFKYTPIYHYY